VCVCVCVCVCSLMASVSVSKAAEVGTAADAGTPTGETRIPAAYVSNTYACRILQLS